MPFQHTPPAHAALRGWRAELWAWVLFAALLKGLIPHAALAAVMMPGTPVLSWCAPGLAPANTDELASGIDRSSTSQHCVCALAGDGVLPMVSMHWLAGQDHDALWLRPLQTAHPRTQRWLPPARGPPGSI